MMLVTKYMLDSEKPGVCPKPRTDIHVEVGCLDQCSTDSECEGNLKCCFDGCGRVCEKPRETKPGSCPRPNPHFTTCPDECSEDSECEKNLKCCYSGCGLQCLPPEHDNSHRG
ncbi:hypothetical protein NQD34_005587 [Periophthalmus magnuspinnatus]|nr:hypothetical protein NQD34_005587 [Periophthalmus magnuspinnatus]